MRNNPTQFDRRAYLKTTGLATAGMIGLAGCTGDGDLDDENGDGDSAFGTLSTSITDQPNDIDDFEELIVTIDGIWIKPDSADDSEEADDDSEEATDNGDDEADEPEANDDAGDENDENDEDEEEDDEETDDEENDENGDDEQEDEEDEDDVEDGDDVDQSEGRRYIEFDEPQQADLVDLQGDNTQLIDETDVEVGDYLFLQLDVSNTEGILVEDGSEADVETPGNAPLQFQQNFEIRADEQTRFIADFAPMRRGQGSYIIRPVATGTRVLYGDEEYTADDDETDGADNETAEGSDDTDDQPNGSDADNQPNGPPEDN